MKSRPFPALRQAIVLLSGGLDSATTLYIAKKEGYKCSCLIFDYGQRHRREVESAKRIASAAGCPYKLIKIDFPKKGSSLLDKANNVPIFKKSKSGIPSTYVPGRNIVFLSLALSFAEAEGAGAIFIGAHAQDYSGYPDCRPEFYRAFSKAIARGTKSGIEGRTIKVEAPLLNKNKSSIIKIGKSLGVPFELTWSCYLGMPKPCGRCDSCYYRSKGFKDAGLTDPLVKR